MRISSNQFYSQGVSSIQKHQEEILNLQLQLSTGKRVNNASDDPVATSQIHALKNTMAMIDQYAENGSYAQTQLEQEETAISDITDSLQRARVLAVQMSSGTYNAENRQAAAEEVGQLIDQVKSMMNYTTSEGEKLFAGSSVKADSVFVEDPTNPGYYAYIGSDNLIGEAEYDPQANYGARFVQIGFDNDNVVKPDDNGDSSRVRTTDNGAKVFKVDGDSLPAGVDKNVLNVLVEFQNQLVAGTAPSDSVIDDIDSSIQQLSVVLTEVGGRQNRIESQSNAGESFKLSLEERRQTLEDVDEVQGITDLTQTQNALEMAQLIFTRVQNLSLFNYLK
ncbi:flagellar hook-associated protein FlgL [Thiomicrorhabdus sp.]|uniref:flagellar hook-associated protein FlgL n=1 Tax=Thiomicrorhabdus sp. TaxID=2039724 RepID=UPI0029C88BBF|nr:flagellar hook-associated protein FlgL [Thiomicrorhabdus sp.]